MNDKNLKLLIDAGHMIDPDRFKNERQGQCDQALLLIQRIAELGPPEAFECESGFGDLDCVFCGTILDGHASDCIAVLIQEFRVEVVEVAEASDE